MKNPKKSKKFKIVKFILEMLKESVNFLFTIILGIINFTITLIE